MALLGQGACGRSAKALSVSQVFAQDIGKFLVFTQEVIDKGVIVLTSNTAWEDYHQRFEAEGRKGVVRLKMPREGQCRFHDLIRGDLAFDWQGV